MSAKLTIRVLTASVLLATALPGFASDKQDSRAEMRLRYENAVRYGQYADAYGPRYEHYPESRRVIQRPYGRDVVVSRPVYAERPVVVHRPVREVIVQRPVYVEPPVYPVYQEAPVYGPAPYYEQRSAIGALGGAAIGAVIGSQVAHPEHRAAATVAGAVIGGVIGSGL